MTASVISIEGDVVALEVKVRLSDSILKAEEGYLLYYKT